MKGEARQWIHITGAIRSQRNRPEGRYWEPLAVRVPDGFHPSDSVMLHATRFADGYPIYIEIFWNQDMGGWERTVTPPMTQEALEHHLLNLERFDEPPDSITSVEVGDDGEIRNQREI